MREYPHRWTGASLFVIGVLCFALFGTVWVALSLMAGGIVLGMMDARFKPEE